MAFRKRRMGRTGIEVTALGVGGANFVGSFAEPTRDDALAISPAVGISANHMFGLCRYRFVIDGGDGAGSVSARRRRRKVFILRGWFRQDGRRPGGRAYASSTASTSV
ncbi:MAG: hypothetical protein ACE5FS_04415 [Paracoccaceae bacterium]